MITKSSGPRRKAQVCLHQVEGTHNEGMEGALDNRNPKMYIERCSYKSKVSKFLKRSNKNIAIMIVSMKLHKTLQKIVSGSAFPQLTPRAMKSRFE
jgi:hypothetical protein